jgi:trk system potassium uptake protein TrkH
MNWTVVQRILGLLLMMFSLTMLPPILIALLFGEQSWLPFVEGFGITLAAGLIFWLPVHRSRKDLRLRDGFLIVAAFWTVLGTAGAAPLYFADAITLSWTDAVFESMSGLTTTGATILTGLDDLPRSILYYRQQLQWLGGMGIIVLAVAVLPMLGVGGMQLYRAETPGPVKDTKLTPRITETAKALWYVYLAFTITCAICYMIAGMDWFDALCHAFSTVAIGGFSTHDMSIGYFNSAAIDIVAIVFMFAAGINFSLHFFAWRYVSIKHYSQDPEFRAYTMLLVVLAVLVVAGLFYHQSYANPGATVINGVFQAVSIATTTGFTTADYSAWPVFLPVALIFERGDTGQTGQQGRAVPGRGCGLGLLLCVHGRFCRVDAGDDGNGSRPGVGFLGYRGNAE